MSEKALIAWSSGKDSAMARYILQQAGTYDIAGLITTVTQDYHRVSMHGVREELLIKQSELLGLNLERIFITKDALNSEYEGKMRDFLLRYKDKGVSKVVFGDIFLEDLRLWREKKLSEIGMEAVFPLWKFDTTSLARKFIDKEFKAIVTCVDTSALEASFSGRDFDSSFLEDLPANVDPCGENGEFHTFVYDGPIFKKPLSCKKGRVVLRDKRFCFCDVVETLSDTASV